MSTGTKQAVGSAPHEPSTTSPGPRRQAVRRLSAGLRRTVHRYSWQRGRWLAGFTLVGALVMAFSEAVPNTPGHLGSLLQTVLPWTGLLVPLLLGLALARRSALAVAAVLAPAVVWCCLFAGTLVDKGERGGDLTVLSHNVNEENGDPGRTARALASSGAGLVALEELPRRATARSTYEQELAAAYPYSAVRGGVGVWSKYPIRAVEPLEIMPWTRALRATVDTPRGPVAVYVAHLASVRVLPTGFATTSRNDSAARLAELVRAEPLPRVVVLGDFNGSTADSSLNALTGQLSSAQEKAGAGFGLTWPAGFPLVRLDQIMVKGIKPVSSWTLPATGSDHLPVAASLKL
ncbi:endonuclease/exonuclease/phosphatase family protein [Streptomyces sp. NPDC048111]|uniref:endonuclease/exonuclease/phosphatase family protein n=1 Tax=Streptomyces sp. NPDC048111 TaxID=3365500 RepID=UPI00371F7006